MLRFFRILLDPSGAEGGGSPTPTPTPTPTPSPAPTPTPAAKGDADPVARYQRLLDKHNGDANKLAIKLHEENFKLRERARELQGKLPAEGTMVLAGPEAKAWETYKALGKPEDLKSALAERTQLKDELDKGRKATLYSRAAAAHGLNEAVLADLAASKGLDIEVKDQQVNGKATPQAFVKHKDAAGKDVQTLLPEYAKTHLGPYLPSLNDKAVGPLGGRPAASPHTPVFGGPPPRPANTPGQPSEGRIYKSTPF